MTLPTLIKQLRDASEKATPGEWGAWHARPDKDPDDVALIAFRETIDLILADDMDPRDADYIALANPANITRLLDALESKDKELADKTEVLKELGRILGPNNLASRVLAKYDKERG